MADIFVEYMVVKRNTSKEVLLRIGLFLAALVIAVLSFLFLFPIGAGGIGLLLVVGAFYGAYYLSSSMNKEFEYIVTNGEMDVDCIMARRKRKRLITVKCKDFDAIGPYDPAKHQGKNYKTRILACDSETSKNVWYCVVHHKTMGETLLVFNATARILEAFKMFIPRTMLNEFNRQRMEAGLIE
ncbi:MAG: hypothetical protein HFE44_04855 [Oscillospiraceae bacterium]|jgi:hypothetical protein|nr:hypothetical protein [Oscillospiraceae bacterium]